MDKLDKIFALQKMLDEEIIEKRKLHNISRDEWVQKEILAIMSELNEIMAEINWKWWKNEKTVDENALKEEIVDVLHFFVSLCWKCGMDSEDLFRIYKEKNKENFARQNGQSEKKGYSIDEK